MITGWPDLPRLLRRARAACIAAAALVFARISPEGTDPVVRRKTARAAGERADRALRLAHYCSTHFASAAPSWSSAGFVAVAELIVHARDAWTDVETSIEQLAFRRKARAARAGEALAVCLDQLQRAIRRARKAIAWDIAEGQRRFREFEAERLRAKGLALEATSAPHGGAQQGKAA